jgi:hypothetical protein
MSRSAADLPEDPAELRRFAAALAAEVHAKTLLIEKLRMQLSILRRARFGRSSEKLGGDSPSDQRRLADVGGKPMLDFAAAAAPVAPRATLPGHTTVGLI